MTTAPTAAKPAAHEKPEGAVALISSRHLTRELVFNLLGRIEQSAKNEIEGLKTKTCAELLAEFAEDKAKEIEACPVFTTPRP